MSALNLESMSNGSKVRRRRPARYVDMAGVGRWFGVSGTTVAMWKSRYEENHPIPEPDVIVGERMWGWAEEREQEWRAWHASRPGQGRGGGRPKKDGPRSGGR